MIIGGGIALAERSAPLFMNELSARSAAAETLISELLRRHSRVPDARERVSRAVGCVFLSVRTRLARSQGTPMPFRAAGSQGGRVKLAQDGVLALGGA
jgi:hypothetical protein